MPLYADAAGRIYVYAPDPDPTQGLGGSRLVVFGPDGALVNSLPVPSAAREVPQLTARRGGGSASMPVPFAPDLLWTVHPSGRFLTGFSADYRIDLPRDDGVLRIERAADPAPVLEGERAAERALTTRYMRDLDPEWSWNGPPIPERKPFYHELLAGRDGRIWVRLSTEARAVPNEDHDPEDPDSEPVEWEEPVRYDVFEPDGTYLGVVAGPDDFTPNVRPVFDGDFAWGVTRDEMGVARVVRYRIAVGEG